MNDLRSEYHQGSALDNVRKLAIVPKYNAQVVEHLELLLERAKAGEVVEITSVAKLDSGEYENSYTGCENLFELVGQLERMKYITLTRMEA